MIHEYGTFSLRANLITDAMAGVTFKSRMVDLSFARRLAKLDWIACIDHLSGVDCWLTVGK